MHFNVTAYPTSAWVIQPLRESFPYDTAPRHLLIDRDTIFCRIDKDYYFRTQQFLGQFVSDWNVVLCSLTLAMVPILILYVICSRQLIRGITSGAVK